MVEHEQKDQLTATERKLYLYGAILFIGLILLTLIFGFFLSPLRLLQLRLLFVGVALIYNFSIFFFYEKLRIKTEEKIPKETQNEIIILFNGRELARK
ncbi:hypothetical protein H1D32_02380 [Anaerobacillus sp. CMMVII]|uniref:hypothetical protein n=1 Tax=Anaerobacillus sp. CMMVII TaxID=2755588 RepID=UPI0021B80057|nr:hypothetical protein [Anaerobacillus sp. CMMVII]MCT8136696.1 hypothetical protein [Anaerobacillus sp. CMMVII]